MNRSRPAAIRRIAVIPIYGNWERAPCFCQFRSKMTSAVTLVKSLIHQLDYCGSFCSYMTWWWMVTFYFRLSGGNLVTTEATWGKLHLRVHCNIVPPAWVIYEDLRGATAMWRQCTDPLTAHTDQVSSTESNGYPFVLGGRRTGNVCAFMKSSIKLFLTWCYKKKRIVFYCLFYSIVKQPILKFEVFNHTEIVLRSISQLGSFYRSIWNTRIFAIHLNTDGLIIPALPSMFLALDLVVSKPMLVYMFYVCGACFK